MASLAVNGLNDFMQRHVYHVINAEIINSSCGSNYTMQAGDRKQEIYN